MSLSLVKDSWYDFPKTLTKLLNDNEIKKVIEVGAGPNPSLSNEIVSMYNIDYYLNDYSDVELKKGYNEYKRFIGDFTIMETIPQVDLIISKMVLEHISEPKKFHQKVYNQLSPGGIAVHFYATLYSLPAILNIILPEIISTKLVNWGQGRDEINHGKFPAMYKWCKGPVNDFKKRFENLGFKVLNHRGYVGHGYLNNKKFLQPFERAYSLALLKLNSPLMCSNAILVLQKPF